MDSEWGEPLSFEFVERKFTDSPPEPIVIHDEEVEPESFSIDETVPQAWQTELPAFTYGFNSRFAEQQVISACKQFDVQPMSVASDGNCLFSSVANQLMDTEVFTGEDLRKQVVWFMACFPEAVFNQLTLLSIVADCNNLNWSVKDYLTNMLSSKVWGGEAELRALSLMLECRITVLNFSENADTLQIQKYRHNKKVCDSHLVLLYNGSNHYSGGMTSLLEGLNVQTKNHRVNSNKRKAQEVKASEGVRQQYEKVMKFREGQDKLRVLQEKEKETVPKEDGSKVELKVKCLIEVTKDVKRELKKVKKLLCEKVENPEAPSSTLPEVRREVVDSKQCPVCGKTFVTVLGCRNHHAHMHLGISLGFDCTECGRKLSSQQGLTRHLKLHKVQEVECFCGKKCSSEEALKQHKAKSHKEGMRGTDEERRCPHCKKIPSSFLKQALEHRKKCNLARSYHCTVEGCNKVYNHKKDMLRHVKKKHGE